VSLPELATATRVPERFLVALETDDLGTLPPAAFTRGFIRAYCQTLGESPEAALALFGGASPSGVSPGPTAGGARAASASARARSRGPVLISFVLLIVLGAVLFAVTVALQSGRGTGRRASSVSDAPARVAPVPAAQVPAVAPTREPVMPAPTSPDTDTPGAATSPTSTARSPVPAASPPDVPPAEPVAPVPSAPPVTSPPPAAPPPAPAEPRVASPTSTYRLTARTTDPTWIRVRTEDGRTTEETIPAGEVREWLSNRPFVLTIGNAGGVTLELNGRPLPSLGPRGQVVRRLVVPPDIP
jgi:cytoskeleton protein RodZ